MIQNLSFDAALDIVNLNINKIKFTQKPLSLFDPITYILSLGGKRIRPALVLLAYDMYAKDYAKAIPACLGVEIFHNFTLLHDDLMDRANVRRGKPCVHIKWNDNAAILSGDAMLIESYKEISKVDNKYLSRTLEIFSKTATEICCGQQLDMEFEQRLDVSLDEYIEMINLKTAVLMGGALEIGALLGGAEQADLDNLYQVGMNLGLAFQIMDDVLDVYGDPATFGKKIGGDILCNKKTYMLISALMDDNEKKELHYWISRREFDEQEKINVFRTIYNRLGIKEKAINDIVMYYDRAILALEKVNVSKEKKQVLYQLAESLNSRNV